VSEGDGHKPRLETVALVVLIIGGLGQVDPGVEGSTLKVPHMGSLTTKWGTHPATVAG